MEQRISYRCPVCGESAEIRLDTPTNGIRCRGCNCSVAFVTDFADQEALDRWQAEIAKDRSGLLRRLQEGVKHGTVMRPVSEFPSMLPVVRPHAPDERRCCTALAAGPRSVAWSWGDAGYYHEVGQRRDEGVRQYSIGARHTAVLHADGTVTATGSNDHGELAVERLQDIVQVAAAQECTYALHRNGRVFACGRPHFALRTGQADGGAAPMLEGWQDIEQLSVSSSHLAGLRKDGTVLVEGYPLQRQQELNELLRQVREVESVCALDNYGTLLLHRDGTVRFIGRDGEDPRREAESWQNIVDISGDRSYAIGLTREGRVLMAGNCPPLLDMGRRAAAQWTDVVSVACSRGGIVGVDMDGRLLLTEGFPQRSLLLESWSQGGALGVAALRKAIGRQVQTFIRR